MSDNPKHLPKSSELALAQYPVMAKKCRASDWAYMQKTCSESFKGKLPDHIGGGEQGYMFSYNFGEPDEVWNWLPEVEFKYCVNYKYKGSEASEYGSLFMALDSAAKANLTLDLTAYYDYGYKLLLEVNDHFQVNLTAFNERATVQMLEKQRLKSPGLLYFTGVISHLHASFQRGSFHDSQVKRITGSIHGGAHLSVENDLNRCGVELYQTIAQLIEDQVRIEVGKGLKIKGKNNG